MRRHTIVRSTCVAAVLAALTLTTAFAQQFDKRTFFTFSGPTAVPGVTLPAGKYLFRLADSAGRDVVQVLSADGLKPYAQFFALRADRPDIAPNPEIRFMETSADMPPAIRTWWYPGQQNGYEFVYPKGQARLLAKGTGQPVLTTQPETATPPETRAADLARISPGGQEAAVAPKAAAVAPVGPILRGEIAPPSVAIPESQQARAELPRTAGTTPLLALAGLLLLGGAALIRGWHVVRG